MKNILMKQITIHGTAVALLAGVLAVATTTGKSANGANLIRKKAQNKSRLLRYARA